jgi:hypothetical protein
MSPIAVFTKLAVMLRNHPAVQLVFAKFAALLRSKKGSGQALASDFLGEASGVTRSTVDQDAAVLQRPATMRLQYRKQMTSPREKS